MTSPAAGAQHAPGPRMIEALSEISGEYDAVFCDLWGCYHDGLKPYAAAVAALRAYRAAGGIVILLTNAPRPAGERAAFPRPDRRAPGQL